MDCRKLLWLGGFFVGGMVGCAQHGVRPPDDANAGLTAAPTEAPNSPPPSAYVRRNPEPPESRELDAKPSSIVKLADVHAVGAVQEDRSFEDRQRSAQMAKQMYRRASQQDPKYLPAYVGMARLCSGLGEFAEALAALDAALAKFPKDASLWYERGMVLGRQQQFDDGLKNLYRAATLEPNNPRYGKAVGLMLARAGHAEESIVWLRRWMSEADARYNAARMMQHIGRDEECRQQLQLALASDPRHEASLDMLRDMQGLPRPVANPEAPAAHNLHPVGHTEPAPPAPALKITIDSQAPAAPPIDNRVVRPDPLTPALSGQLDRAADLPKPRGPQLRFEPNP